MIYIQNITIQVVAKTPQPKQHVEPLMYPDNKATKRDIAEFIMDSYDLGLLNTLNHHSATHVLSFTAINQKQLFQITSDITKLD